MYLRIKINVIVINKLLRILYTFSNYVKVFKQFIDINLHLRNTSALLN